MYVWISIPLCFIYVIAILGNCTILCVIRREPSLHEPMYYFLSMLTVSDLGLSFSSIPTVPRIFLFNSMDISAAACIAQEFFRRGFTDMESSVLLIMSFDHFVAIHHPLRDSSILTSSRVGHIRLVFAVKSILLVLPLPFTLKRLRYCQKRLLSYTYCLHQDVMKLACSDNRVNFYSELFVSLYMMSDSMFVAVSYVFILKTVLVIAACGEQLKALNSCFSHISAGLIFYVSTIILAVMPHFAKHKSPLAMSLIADAFLLVPPLMNPIAYCVKTEKIREKVLEKLGQKRPR